MAYHAVHADLAGGVANFLRELLSVESPGWYWVILEAIACASFGVIIANPFDNLGYEARMTRESRSSLDSYEVYSPHYPRLICQPSLDKGWMTTPGIFSLEAESRPTWTGNSCPYLQLKSPSGFRDSYPTTPIHDGDEHSGFRSIEWSRVG